MMIVTVVYRQRLYTALGILLLLSASGLAVEQAYAQEQPLNLFSAIPDDTDNTPLSLDARSGYLTASEMVILNADALQSDSSLNVTMFGNTYTISKDLVEMRGDGDYTWFGSGDQISNAIFVVNGTHASGLIYTATKTFEILHVSGSIHEIYDLDMSQFPPVSSGQTNTARAAQDTPDMDLISQLESAYIGWQEYDTGRAETVTIDVFIVVTEKAIRDYGFQGAYSMVNVAVDNANAVYRFNDLPISLNLVYYYTVSGYTDAGNLETDLRNLMNSDDRSFVRARVLIDQADADVVVMLAGDYTPSMNDDNFDKLNTCGHAPDRMVVSSDTAFGAVESVCIAAHSFTHVIGLMQGAGPNIEQGTNSEFRYGHGYYHAGVDRRTIMSQSAGNCDDPRTTAEEVCEREQIWSDPYRVFFGTGTPAGTPYDWNARVVFATAPHIASLNGPAQSYDSVMPTGSIELPSPLPSRGTLDIVATFSEPIHEWFPPVITITDGNKTTTAIMTRSSETEYTYPHMLDGESGTVHLLFSNARDVFGNPVNKNPVSGGTFLITTRSVTPPSLPENTVTSISETFDNELSMWNLGLPGNGNWTITSPTEDVPDAQRNINKVLTSDNCDDSCTATLKRTLNTLEPLVISFERYVDKRVDRDEGLHVEYSVDGGSTWITLASYTHNNGENTRRWEKTVLGLSIPESSAQFRFHAKSNQDDEYVEVNNLRIFRPSGAVPDATFLAALNDDLTSIALSFSHTIPQVFTPSNFTLSHGSVTGVAGTDPNTQLLGVTGVPYDTAVSVTYVGDTLDIGGGAYLVNGTVGTTNVVTSTLDDMAPMITVPPDMTVEAEGQYTVVDIGIANATDGMDPNPTIIRNGTSSFRVGTTVITWTATDSSGNSANATQIITIRDTTPPTITKPANKTFEATGEQTSLTADDIGTATANDRVDPNPTVTSNIPPSFEIGTTIITWTATDSYGNSDTATQIITIRDTTPPTITKPANKTFEATGEMTLLTADDIGTATANDRVDPNPTIRSDAVSTFRVGTTPITWTATDSYGNSDTATQIITIRDTTPPDITAPADVSFTTTDTSIVLTSANYSTATATDLVDSSPTITNNAPPSFQADRTTTITWTATDKYLNSANATQSVTVVHSSLRIFVPADITVEADHVNNTVNIGNANATHDTDNNITITNNAPPLFDVGVTVVTWTATDSIGVTVTATQTITVQDTTDPILYSVPDLDFVFEIDTPIIINYDYPAATDLADDSVDVACTPASGTVFNENTTVVTCTATDDSGNTADITFNVDVVVFDPNIFSDNFEDGSLDGWTVTDHVETWAAVPLEENVYPPGHASTNKVAEVIFCDITCSMTTSGIDLSGHDDPIFLQFYRYADNSLDSDSYFQVETYNGSSWVVFDKWIPDNFHHDDAWHLEQYSLSDYTHVRDFGIRFTAYMESSSESVGIDDVRVFFVPEQVSDGTVPVIVSPVSIVAEAAGALTTVDIGNAIATPATNITISNDAPTSFPLGSTTVTWTATDSSDNSDTATQRITIHDTTPPDITAPADVSFTITGTSIALTASDYGASTATDLIDSSPTIDSNAPDLFPLGNTTITWTATDDYGNSAQATQQVTVILSSLMITAPADITVEATGTLTTVDIGNATATHDTDTDITVTNDAPPSFRVGTTTVITWTATDSVNDVVTDTQTITVQDTTPPVFDPVTNLDFIFEPDVPLAINYDSPTATDSVNGSVDVTCTPASGTVFVENTTAVTCTAADDSGNTADITFNVDVLVLSATIFLDDFEDRRLDGWTVTDYSDTWDSYTPEGGVNPPDHPVTNKVAQVSWCDITCTMSITGFDLSMHAYPEFLQFYRYVDDELDNGEYLLLEVYDGSSWTELDRWTPEDSENDDAWHLEEYSLADYTEVTDFGMRFTTVMSSLDEVVAIDDIRIFLVP